jgi:arylformamidase
MQQDWIDVSIALSETTFVWPGDPSFSTEALTNFENDDVRVSCLRMCAHTGTHVDAPAHYLDDGAGMESWPIDATVGPCVVLDLSGDGQRITADELARHDIRPGERLLLRTANSSRHLYGKKEFTPDFTHLSPDGAAHLASRGVRCVGIDYLSVGGMEDGDLTHKALLAAGIWVIGGLDLRAVKPGEYRLVCLPLKVSGLEGAPARAILSPAGSRGTPDFIDDAVEWASQTG